VLVVRHASQRILAQACPNAGMTWANADSLR